MKTNRRNFIKTSAMAAASLAVPATSIMGNNKTFKNKSSARMKLTWTTYDLQLKHVFTISGFSRKTTPVVLTKIEYDGLVGYGEASLPPYLGETQASVIEFLKKVDLSPFSDPTHLEEILHYIDHIAENNTAAKASIDIALHDLTGKIIGAPWHKIWGLNKMEVPDTTFTIGIDTDEMVRKKTREVLGDFNILKIKVGGEHDKRMIEAIRSVTELPMAVDANQGWKDKHEALDMIHWLKEKGIVMVEQPMPKYDFDNIAWLTERSPLPIFADESLQRLRDIEKMKGVFSGINIKLMKCTGMREAWKMRNLAEALNMKVMIGCMTETSCAISAASQLSAGLDFADLDGALLISNDCFEGAKLEEGKIIASDLPGIGVKLTQKLFK
ncbi:MAG: enolase C-terminal domain-like protein [Dysgonamonadaceae bacterium]|nr:enolase C-terminal domain-like protein [Dysgonamonadaceae bacterium]MDD4728527.1 enolase C-terminal domain-like protein [Dysgonamonadaceae bacterium]